MRLLKIDLTDEQLLTLAKIALSPGGAVDDYGVALLQAGVKPSETLWLRDQGYLEVATRKAPGGDLPQLRTTAKGRRELMIRFVD